MPTNNTENIYSTEFENDPNPIPSSKIGYDNTESGLEATTVQGAIDELDSKIKASDEASEVTYDNTESGLEATTVQGAIDEIDEKVDKLSGGKLYLGCETIASQSGVTTDAYLSNVLTAVNNYLTSLPDDVEVEFVSLYASQYGSLGARPTYRATKNTTLQRLGFTRVACSNMEGTPEAMILDYRAGADKRATSAYLKTAGTTFTDELSSSTTYNFSIEVNKYRIL